MIAPVRVVSLSFLLADFLVAYIEILIDIPRWNEGAKRFTCKIPSTSQIHRL